MSNTTNKGHVLLGLILGLMVAVFAALIGFMLMSKNNTPINEASQEETNIQQPQPPSDPNKSLYSKVPLAVDDKKTTPLTENSDKVTEDSNRRLKSSEEAIQDIQENGLASTTTAKKKKKELPVYIDKYGEKKYGTPTEGAISVDKRDPDDKPKEAKKEVNPNTEIDPIANILNQKQSKDKEKVVKTKAEKDGTFFIQVGSFKSAEQADKQKAVLLMQGMNSQVTEAQREGSTVHRVRMGPFYSKKEVEDLTKRLNNDGMAYRVIKTNE